MIKLSKLDKYFNRHSQNEVHVIDNISLELPEKGMTAIFGRSGCGKTTLLNVIGGLDNFSGGEVLYDGKSIKNDTDYVRNSSIGYIFQNYCLNFDKTVFENVADILRLCGEKNTDIIEARVVNALSSVGMEKFRNRTPDNLSGGQQQRVAIARAIVKAPKIILADEPTGNLDDANTIAVMDMLKAISENCLVLLVTHEARLVDYYCDSIVELSDGKIVTVRQISDSNGYLLRGKNDIYLGELEKSETEADGLKISYYGDKMFEPLDIKIVNINGGIYLKLNADKVHLVDGSGEVRLLEGTFDEKIKEKRYDGYESLSPLPKRNKSEYGKLFTFFGSMKRGFSNQLGDKKKGKKFMRFCMGAFAVVIVIFSAIYGRKVEKIVNIKKEVSPNIFALKSSLDNVGTNLEEALKNKTAGIDYYYFTDYLYDVADGESFRIQPDYFISSKGDISLYTSAGAFPKSLAERYQTLYGQKTDSEYGIWITRYIADELLDCSNVSFIKNYSDLIGLKMSSYDVEAILDSSEPAVFLPDEIIQQTAVSRFGLQIKKAPDSDIPTGKTVLIKDSKEEIDVNVGSKININGHSFEVFEIAVFYGNYSDWMEIVHPDHYALCENYLKRCEYMEPQVVQAAAEDGAFIESLKLNPKNSTENNYALVPLYAYRYFDEWVNYCIDNNISSKYFEEAYAYKKGICDYAKYIAFGDEENNAYKFFYAVQAYLNQSYNERILPDENFLHILKNDTYSFYEYTLDFLQQKFWSESRSNEWLADAAGDMYDVSLRYYFKLNSEDYALVCCGYGKTDRIVDNGLYEDSISAKEEYEKFSFRSSYLVVHSNNPKETEKFLVNLYGSPDEYSPDNDYTFSPRFVTPKYICDEKMADFNLSLIGGIVPFAVVIVLLCVCVYFMIRSTLMNRVKEVGTYRAIGVTKGNLRFAFMSETFALICTSVIPWFIVSSALFVYMEKSSTLIKQVIFYPLWFAVLLFAFVVGICLLCGIMPIDRLLRKTPAELMAKYDI